MLQLYAKQGNYALYDIKCLPKDIKQQANLMNF